MKKFVVTIGRQYGSGGREIGEYLAGLLEVKYYDDGLIQEAARNSGLSSELLKEKDEKIPNTWSYAFSATTGFSLGFGQESLFKIQSDTIRSLVAKSSCVIVGRSADYVLRNNPRCITIFIHAPAKERIPRVARRNSITEKEAAERIVKTDKARAAYYNFYTNKHWGASQSYDLSIDSSLLGIEGTAEAIRRFVLDVLEAGNK